jgi:hypothetical protein
VRAAARNRKVSMKPNPFIILAPTCNFVFRIPEMHLHWSSEIVDFCGDASSYAVNPALGLCCYWAAGGDGDTGPMINDWITNTFTLRHSQSEFSSLCIPSPRRFRTHALALLFLLVLTHVLLRVAPNTHVNPCRIYETYQCCDQRT